LLVILLVLIALVARIDAAPGGASVDRAIRSADAWTGAGYTGPREEDDEDGDEEAEDRAAERAAIDDRDGDEIALASLGFEGDAGDSPASLGLDGDAGGALASLGLEDAGDAPASLGLDGDTGSALANLGLDAGDGAPASLALGGDGELGWSAGAGALAMLDAELAPGDTTAGLDAADAGATAGAQEAYEEWMRHRRPSPWGRLDVGVSWRHHWREPIHTPAYSHDEIWLVATWRR
jgi:hypothetical protein